MEEAQTPPADFIKGFNDGYLLSKHEPELASMLAKTVHDSNRFSGIKAGIEEYTTEQNKSFYPSWMLKNMSSEKGKDVNNEKNLKDDFDLEK